MSLHRLSFEKRAKIKSKEDEEASWFALEYTLSDSCLTKFLHLENTVDFTLHSYLPTVKSQIQHPKSVSNSVR